MEAPPGWGLAILTVTEEPACLTSEQDVTIRSDATNIAGSSPDILFILMFIFVSFKNQLKIAIECREAVDCGFSR